MTHTPHLDLTLVETAQAQKEVTVNEALSRIDAILNTAAVDRGINTPPGSPSQGDVYIIGSSPTGDWSGKGLNVAYFDGVWRFIAPHEGLTLWVADEDLLYTFDGSAWVASTATVSGTVALTVGSAGSPTLTYSGDSNTGLFSPGADQVSITTGGTERARVSSSGLTVTGCVSSVLASAGDAAVFCNTDSGNLGPTAALYHNSATPAANDLIGMFSFRANSSTGVTRDCTRLVTQLTDATNASEDANLLFLTIAGGTLATRMGIYGSDLLVAKAATDPSAIGVELRSTGLGIFTTSNTAVMIINRQTDDGVLMDLRQANTSEGQISVSGTTVSYTSFCGGHWSQLADNANPAIAKGTVVSTIDAMCAWPGEDNEQLVRFKVSDAEADRRVYGVFCTWDEEGDAIIHAVGATVIRVTGPVQGGDLLESAGDGTARAQTDDILRASTIGKATHGDALTEERLVPCVLYCG